MSCFWTAIFRTVIVLALAGHVFYMYNFARISNGGFGFAIGTFVLATLFAAAMLIPLFWAAWLGDLPEALSLGRAWRRYTEGKCCRCGYTFGEMSIATCSECGATRQQPDEYVWSWRPVRRFGVFAMFALVLGIGASETMLTCDEVAFRKNATALQERQLPQLVELQRPRMWPNTDASLRYSTLDGFTASPQ